MERRRILVVAAALVAVLGGILVAVYVHGSDDRAQAAYDLQNVLVATAEIPAGESYGEATDQGKIDVRRVVVSDVLSGAVTSIGQIDRGQVAQAAIYPGEQIVSQKFGAVAALPRQATTSLELPAGDIAISVSLSDPGRVAGFVTQGSHVAIFATSPAYSRVLLPDVLVIGVGSSALTDGAAPAADGTTDGQASSLPSTLLTIAVTQAEAQKVLLAQQAAPTNQLAFGLLNARSRIATQTVVDPGNLFR